jgi:D-3-phosphoglycerate dehydrogenase
VRRYADLLADELNVKRVDVVLADDETATQFGLVKSLTVNARTLGPRVGKDVQRIIQASKAGNWQLAPGQTVAGRTLGLYGYGRIAKQMAHFAQDFGMRVQWWSSEAGRARAAADGASVAPSREAFFATSDFVSVHVRLKPTTHAIISLADLLAMKPSASFINTSRAALVEPGAIETALQAGRPGRFALDVFDREPMTAPVDPIVLHPNVIATPHVGYVTEDEFDLQFSDIYRQINAFADGAPIHMANPEALEQRQSGA